MHGLYLFAYPYLHRYKLDHCHHERENVTSARRYGICARLPCWTEGHWSTLMISLTLTLKLFRVTFVTLLPSLTCITTTSLLTPRVAQDDRCLSNPSRTYTCIRSHIQNAILSISASSPKSSIAHRPCDRCNRTRTRALGGLNVNPRLP